MNISTILSQIDLGSYAMPVFQRGYVWNRDQVRKLMSSLYREYPIGQLLVWNTTTDPSISRGNVELTPGNVNLILDGQQRITTLYGIIRGKPPKFFEGNSYSFTNLYFNVENETFEFYSPAKMANDRSWISVTEVMQKGASVILQQKLKEDTEYWLDHSTPIIKLYNIQNTEINIQTVSGNDKTIDIVVEIFNNVNSGGTKLSKGDLALAKICAEWTDARNEISAVLLRFKNAGYDFSIEWFLRCVTVYLTAQPYFNALGQTPIDKIKKAVSEVEKAIGTCLDHIGTRLGLDHGRVLGNAFGIVTMIGYINHRGGKLDSAQEWDRLLYWYVHAFLWGRYAGSTESVLAQDMNAISRGDGIDGLIRLLKQSRGDLIIRQEDFWGWSTGARFYPLLYMLTRVNHARDWGTNVELRNNLLGKNSTLEVHHIFPKDVLYKAGKNKAIVNSLANYAFLTKDTNIEILNSKPQDYLPVYLERCPGAIESHWVPTNPEMWKIENYEEFLTQRRTLLAQAANTLLNDLLNGKSKETEVISFATKHYTDSVTEAEEIEAVSEWLATVGLNEGTANYELLDESGNVVAIIDLAWPQGIQVGLSEPIALLLNETAETQAIVSKHGYRYYTSSADLKEYVETSILS